MGKRFYPEEYIKILDEKGVNLSKYGVTEIALDRHSALKSIEILKEAKIPILGGDTWRLNGEKMSMTLDSWYCDKDEYSSYNEYLKESWATTEKHITEYDDSIGGTAFFVLVA